MGSGPSSSQSRDSAMRLPHSDSSHWNHIRRLLDPIANSRNPQWEEVMFALESIAQLSGFAESGHKVELPSLYEFIKRTRNEYLGICPYIARLALGAPQDFPERSIPILAQHTDSSVALSPNKVKCLLALMFWCAFPKKMRNETLSRDFTLYKVFAVQGDVQISKLYCFFSYFKTSEFDTYNQNLEFFRVTSNVPQPTSQCVLLQMQLIDQPHIQLEEIPASVKVDFANKWFGGGVVTHGSAQEECMLLAYVEPIVGVLFIEQLQERDVLYILRARMFNRYTGFTHSFRWVSRVERPVADDSVILAIDADDYRRRVDYQYSKGAIARDFMKVYIGFLGKNTQSSLSVITGNWGCGVFEGNPQLKFIIQWLAASFCQRNLVYVTFGRPELQDAQQLVALLTGYPAQDMLRILFEYELVYRQKTVFQHVVERMQQGVNQGMRNQQAWSQGVGMNQGVGGSQGFGMNQGGVGGTSHNYGAVEGTQAAAGRYNQSYGAVEGTQAAAGGYNQSYGAVEGTQAAAGGYNQSYGAAGMNQGQGSVGPYPGYSQYPPSRSLHHSSNPGANPPYSYQ